MKQTDENCGYVYLLTNEYMPGIVKIGMTSRSELDSRLNELYTTGVPVPFECVYACKTNMFKELEKALHDAFEPNRVNPNREFFCIKPSQAIAILKLFNAENVTGEVAQEMENDIPQEEQQQIKRRSVLRFQDMGIPVGAILQYCHDEKEQCEVVDQRKVKYKGENRSLTSVTKELLNCKWAPQPTPHWEFNGKNLSDIYEDWQKSLQQTEED